MRGWFWELPILLLYLTFCCIELPEGWQREGGVGNEVDGVQAAADVFFWAGLDAAHVDRGV